MDKYSISVIVLTYRKFDNLENNLKSIMEQDFDNYEVILCDDGSPEFDEAKINDCGKGIENLTVIHSEKNLGTVKNYNKAVKAAQGTYIVPLSQDDVYCDRNALKDIFEFFERTGCDVFTACSVGRSSGRVLPGEYERTLLKSGDLRKIWIRCAYANFISGSCLYYRKEYLYRMGLFDEDLYLVEDFPMVMKTLRSGEPILLLEKTIISYGECGVTGDSSKPSELLLRDNVKIYEKYIVPYTGEMGSSFNRKIIGWRKNRWEHFDSVSKYRPKYFDVIAWHFFTKMKSVFDKSADVNVIRYDKMFSYEERHNKNS